jgi:hypothetical protein
LSRFLEFAGQLNGEPVNFAKLSKQIGSAGKTAQDYFIILVDTLIAIQLPGWSESVKKQLLQNGREVDLILARNVKTPVAAIEIKASENPVPEHCPGFEAFREDYPNITRICVCKTPRPYQREVILFLPWQDALKDPKQLYS